MATLSAYGARTDESPRAVVTGAGQRHHCSSFENTAGSKIRYGSYWDFGSPDGAGRFRSDPLMALASAEEELQRTWLM